jgi:hypothetical protein
VTRQYTVGRLTCFGMAGIIGRSDNLRYCFIEAPVPAGAAGKSLRAR